MRSLYWNNQKTITLRDNLPNLKQHYVDFFATGRFYDDGRYYYLASDPAVYHFLMKSSMQLVTSVDDDSLKRQEFRYYIQPNGYYLPVYQSTGLYDGFDIIVRAQHYFDFYCFAGSDATFKLTNTFLNMPHLFDDFVAEYKKQTQTLRQQLHSDLQYLPPSLRCNITGMQQYRSPKRYYFDVMGKKSYLTRKEAECCQYLIHGDTAKIIARKMELSPRTVEGHLRNIKARLTIRYNHELIAILRRLKHAGMKYF